MRTRELKTIAKTESRKNVHGLFPNACGLSRPLVTLASAWQKRYSGEERMPDFAIERGCPGMVCGVDEAGRGPLAGPVVAAAVIPHRQRFCGMGRRELGDSE